MICLGKELIRPHPHCTNNQTYIIYCSTKSDEYLSITAEIQRTSKEKTIPRIAFRITPVSTLVQDNLLFLQNTKVSNSLPVNHGYIMVDPF